MLIFASTKKLNKAFYALSIHLFAALKGAQQGDGIGVSQAGTCGQALGNA